MLTDDERAAMTAAIDTIIHYAPSEENGAFVAKLRAIAAPRVATAGELLEPTHIVEFMFEGDWYQAKRVMRLRHWQARYWMLGRGTWSTWTDSPQRVGDEGWFQRARIVPASEADRDPATRGPIGEG